jgi:hypothetical protein
MDYNNRIKFIGIGAMKAGTSWLHYNFGKLSQIYSTPIKEIHYFDRSSKYYSVKHWSTKGFFSRFFNFQWQVANLSRIGSTIKKDKNYKQIGFYLKWYFLNYTDKWYFSLFKNCPDNCITGEITPAYSMLDTEDIKHMYSILPNVKIIYLLRNPIERSLSQYQYSKQKGLIGSNIDFYTFFNSKEHQKRSKYVETIERYMSVYPKDQILICFFDAIKFNPKDLLENILEFIGQDSKNVENLTELNKKILPSEKVIHPTEVYEFLKKMHYDEIKTLARNFGGYCNDWLNQYYDETSVNNFKNKSVIKLNEIEFNGKKV